MYDQLRMPMLMPMPSAQCSIRSPITVHGPFMPFYTHLYIKTIHLFKIAPATSGRRKQPALKQPLLQLLLATHLFEDLFLTNAQRHCQLQGFTGCRRGCRSSRRSWVSGLSSKRARATQ
jgi:hypothetical protein